MLDYLIDISPERTPGSPLVNRCYFSPIRTAVAGLGYMFARYARQSGFDRSVLIGAIGHSATDPTTADFAGQITLDTMARDGIESRLAFVEESTGQVAMVFPEPRHRFIVANSGANAMLGAETVEMLDLSVLDETDVLFVSGYFLVKDAQRRAVQALMRRARAAGALVVVDVVPHEIWQSVPSRDYLDWIADANSIMITNYTLFDHLGWDRAAAGWDAPDRLVTAGDLTSLLPQLELIVVVLNSKSDYLVVARDGSLTFHAEHVPYKVSQTRDSMEVHAMVLAEYLKSGRRLDGLAAKLGEDIVAPGAEGQAAQ